MLYLYESLVHYYYRILVTAKRSVVFLNYSNFISKTASDKNGEKLGKIIRIDNLTGKTIKKSKPYAIVQVKQFLRREIHAPIDLEKVIKEREGQVLFDISKEDFEEEIKRMKILRNERETYDEFVPVGNPMSSRGNPDIRPRPRRKKK